MFSFPKLNFEIVKNLYRRFERLVTIGPYLFTQEMLKGMLTSGTDVTDHQILLNVNKKGEGKVNVELVTRQDLEEFKNELFQMLQTIISKPTFGDQKWLKSYQVKNMLKISNGTLHNLRTNGTLRFTKIGGILYYKHDDILKVLEGKDRCTSSAEIINRKASYNSR